MTNSTEEGLTGIQVTEYTLFAIIFLIGVTGNTLVGLVIFQTPRMRTTRNYLLVNLAVSDLMVALLCIPFDVVLKIIYPVWPLGAAMCKVLWPAMTLFTNCSAATLAAISYDRYRAVIHPWKPRFTTIQTAIIISTTWLMSLILVLPYILALKMQDGYCGEDWPVPIAVKLYTMGLFIFQYALPLLIIGYAYTMVALKLREQASRIAKNRQASGISDSAYNKAATASSKYSEPCEESELHSNDPSTPFTQSSFKKRQEGSKKEKASSARQEEKRLHRNTKIVKMLVAVVLLYAICLLPNQVVWLWYEFGSGAKWIHLDKFLTFGSIMVYVNSCVNPLLYAGMNDEFRKGFVKILKCRCKIIRSYIS